MPYNHFRDMVFNIWGFIASVGILLSFAFICDFLSVLHSFSYDQAQVMLVFGMAFAFAAWIFEYFKKHAELNAIREKLKSISCGEEGVSCFDRIVDDDDYGIKFQF